VRQGTESDLQELHRLIRELAEYERCAGEVEAGVDELRQWGFGPGRLFGFFVAERQDSIVGIALYYFKYSTWKGRCLFLEDLIVTEAERRKGYGTMLFEAVVALAKREQVRRLEWQVLDWNKPALDFYHTYDAVTDGEWLNCKLTLQQLQRL
jgi:GNAT superfamily N-acetyltransferase